jgi:hypothetical protein
MKYRIRLVRGYYELRDERNRVIALAFNRERLMQKLGHWLLQQTAENTKQQ